MADEEKRPIKLGVNVDATQTLERLYDEALSPAAVEAGDRGREAAQAFKLITVPLAAAGNVVEWLFQNPVKAVRFLSAVVRRIKGHARQPNPQFAGELLEGVKHVQEHSETWELYANLLAAAVDSDAPEEVQHPAFAQIVRGMAPGEAQLFRQIGDAQVYVWFFGHSSMQLSDSVIYTFDSDLHLSQYMAVYLRRLQSATLVEVPELDVDEKSWKVVKTVDRVPRALRNHWDGEQLVFQRQALIYTEFGELFAEAALRYLATTSSDSQEKEAAPQK